MDFKILKKILLILFIWIHIGFLLIIKHFTNGSIASLLFPI